MNPLPIREDSADLERTSFSVCRDSLEFPELFNEVEELLERATIRNPYFTPEWIECWWKRMGPPARPLVMLARNEDGRLEGFWPFIEKKSILWTKGLWPMVYDEANYFVPIATEGGMPALIEGLKKQLREFQFFWIPLMNHTFWEKYLSAETKDKQFLHLARSPRKTSFLEPGPESFDEFWSKKMGTKSRKSLRYDQKSLREKGKVEIVVATSEKDILSLLPGSCLVEVNSWKSQQIVGLYSIRGKRAFFFELLPKLAKKGRACVTMIRVEDEPIAWELDLLDKDFLGVHNLSFDQGWKKYSPGKQLMEINMRRAWDDGRKIDFLPCNFEYKEKVATHVEPVRELHLFKKSLCGYLAKRLIKWNRKIRKEIVFRAQSTKASEPLRKAMEVYD